MALTSHGNWTPVLPDGPAFSGCVFGEWSACSGVPDNADGSDGDVRVDLNTGKMYTKSNGAWAEVGSGGGGGGSADLNGSGSPVGVATPDVINQKYRDDDSDTYWWATGLTSADWHQFV